MGTITLHDFRNLISSATLSSDINTVIMTLSEKTTISPGSNLLKVKKYFQMGFDLMDYVLEHPDGIKWDTFALLLGNLTRYYDVFATPDPSVCNHSELRILKAIRMTKNHKDSLPCAKMCTCEASILLNGWWYDESKKLLDESLEIISKHGNATKALAYTYLMQAYWHEQYGQTAECLKFGYKFWEQSTDRASKSFAAIYLAFQLSILELKDDAMRWLDRADVANYPDSSVVSINYNLTIALLFRDNYTLSNNCLSKVETTLNKLNPHAALQARLFYTRSLLTDGKESEDEYNKYMNIHANHYASSNGAKIILTAGRICRYIDIGAKYSASVSHKTLENFDLMDPKYAISVRMVVCVTQIIYYRSVGEFGHAWKYYTLGIECAKDAIPSQDSMKILKQIFEGELPTSVSGEDEVWGVEYQYLLTLIALGHGSNSEVLQQIRDMQTRFPKKHELLETIYVNFSSEADIQKTIKAWNKCIRMADDANHNVAIMCARLSISRGLYYQGILYYKKAVCAEGFRLEYNYKKVPIWIEYLLGLERCGYHRKAFKLWNQLESTAARTNQLCDVFQSHGNCLYEQEEYAKALKEYENFLSEYLPKSDLIDERLSSVYSHQAACFINLSDYPNALEAILNAKRCSPMIGSDAFIIEYNHANICIALDRFEEARELIQKAKALARSNEERYYVEELNTIYRGRRKPSKRVDVN